MRTIKLNKNKGIVFWITGLSGSGKTSIANKITSSISKKYGLTLTVSGDDLRKLFNYHGAVGHGVACFGVPSLILPHPRLPTSNPMN